MNQAQIATLLQSLPTTPQESFHALLERLFGFENLALAQTSVLEGSSLFDPKEAIIYFTNADYEAHLRQAPSTKTSPFRLSLSQTPPDPPSSPRPKLSTKPFQATTSSFSLAPRTSLSPLPRAAMPKTRTRKKMC